MRAVQITEFGGPEVLTIVDLPEPTAGQGQLLVKVDRAGINYADTHMLENTYLAESTLPMVPGGEVVGRTADGRRVLAMASSGGYAEYAVTIPGLAWDIPDGVSDGAALALLIQGATAWHLLRTSAHLARGESVLVLSAAGGVGSLAVQLAKLWGAGRVIGTASSADKRELAVSLGADVAIDGSADGLAERVLEANHGKPVDIVLEMTGGQVFDESLRALGAFGRLVAYGAASRTHGDPVEPRELMTRSKAVIGFWLQHCFRRPEMMTEAITDLFGLVVRGDLVPQIGGDYPMSQIVQAHRDIRSRRTTGKLIIDPTR